MNFRRVGYRRGARVQQMKLCEKPVSGVHDLRNAVRKMDFRSTGAGEKERLPGEAEQDVAIARALWLGAGRLGEDDVVHELLRRLGIAVDDDVLVERLRVADEPLLSRFERERL